MNQNQNPYAALRISERAQEFVYKTETELAPVFARIEAIEYQNEAKVLHAMQQERIALHHFAPTTGYGYDDIGRDVLDRVFAHALDAEDALVRPQFTSGTHAIFTALSGLLEPGNTMLSATGRPYDTLEKAIGISGEEYGSLRRMGVQYEEVPLTAEGKIDVDSVVAALLRTDAAVVYFQRSRGYAWRNALLPETDLAPAFAAVRKTKPSCTIVVDNCYGEFTRPAEPTAFGADVEIGSLIKNPGGGIAPTGGYIAGRRDLIESCAYRLTTPGTGREIGCTLGNNRELFMGTFHAPNVTGEALKTAVFTAALFEGFGFDVTPRYDEPRADIIQAVQLREREALCAFIRGIQQGAPVDSFVVPEPSPMPGYDCDVIMASGSFTFGSSIELSADAPLREPFAAWMQGGVNFNSGRLGAILAAQSMLNAGFLNL